MNKQYVLMYQVPKVTKTKTSRREAMTVALEVDIHLDNDILRITPCLYP